MKFDFTALCVPHRQTLVTRMQRYTRDTALAEDIVQNTLLKALEVWDTFTPQDEKPNALPWLTAIATHKCMTEFKLSKRRLELEEDCQDEIAYNLLQPEEETPSQHADSTAVREIIDGLIPEHKDILTRCYVESKSQAAVANDLGVASTTVRTRLARARNVARPRLVRVAREQYGLKAEGFEAKVQPPEPALKPVRVPRVKGPQVTHKTRLEFIQNKNTLTREQAADVQSSEERVCVLAKKYDVNKYVIIRAKKASLEDFRAEGC